DDTMSTASAPLASRLRRARPPARVQAPPSPAPPPAASPPPAALAPDPSWPARVTLRRVKGWRLPGDAVVVTRQGRWLWGNPFRIVPFAGIDRTHPWRVTWCGAGCGVERPRPEGWEAIRCPDRKAAQVVAVQAFERWLADPAQADLVERARTDLRGKPLAC